MGQHPVILIADDDPKIREALSSILEGEEYAVISVASGEEALHCLDDASPDVILLDLSMPGMNGFDVLKRLKTDTATMHIPIVIITGRNDIDSRVEALKLGADDFLQKPPHYAELIARVRSLVKVKAYNDYMIEHQQILEQQVAERTKELQGALEKLREASLDTIVRLSRAAEYRDENTSEHLQRMSSYAAVLAAAYGMSREEVDVLRRAAPMHDIGKIGIPDSVLLKKGKLTEDEWVLMKTHPQIGAQILEGSKSELLMKGRIIAMTHHEKWDGSGYPKGLAGGDIPLEGRITAVADVFDALTSKRPYKEAISAEKAFSIIREGRGRHFDPELTDIFLAMKTEIRRIMK
jgi:putative two-component system response regulator